MFSDLLQNKILADVPHAQWVFSIPKMLRLYFLHHRELLGELARLAYETVREMMAAAVEELHARPGMGWQHFLECIKNRTRPECGLEEGKRALRVGLAAMASLSDSAPVRIVDAPREIRSYEGRR